MMCAATFSFSINAGLDLGNAPSLTSLSEILQGLSQFFLVGPKRSQELGSSATNEIGSFLKRLVT